MALKEEWLQVKNPLTAYYKFAANAKYRIEQIYKKNEDAFSYSYSFNEIAIVALKNER